MALTVPWTDSGEKRARLLRVKLVATSLLPVMAVLFILSAHYEPRLPPLAWLEAFAEAALVGGLADWFAVVALFRRPGGLPLPHTAIIPRNKDRIGAQLGEFVEQNFLTPENITAKLRDSDLASRAVGWFARPENARRLIVAARTEMPRVIRAVDDPEIERAIARVVSAEIERLELTHLAAGLLAVLTRGGRLQRFVDDVLPAASDWLDSHRPQIKLLFGGRPAYVPQWMHAYVIDRFVDGIIDKLAEVVRSPDHPLRVTFERAVRRFVTQLETDPEIARDIDEMRTQFLQSRAIAGVVRAVWRALKIRINESSQAGELESDAWLARLVARVADEILADRPLLERLNANVLAAVEDGMRRSKNQFAALIEDIVRKWDSELVTDKVELELGPDLQFIRLNGTFIGGLAGVALHGALLLAAVR